MQTTENHTESIQQWQKRQFSLNKMGHNSTCCNNIYSRQ